MNLKETLNYPDVPERECRNCGKTFEPITEGRTECSDYCMYVYNGWDLKGLKPGQRGAP